MRAGTALSSSGAAGKLLRCLCAGLVGFNPAVALALPESGNVVSGNAQIILTSPTEMQIIQHTDTVAIDWHSFNIGANEVVLFIQNSALAQALNRVLDGGTSQILGHLSANGQIILSNPAGINFGPLATIDVQSLIATTANIGNTAFAAGNLNFDQAGNAGAVVINQGQINIKQSGFAALVAPGVVNAGVINARLGKVSLASADTFAVDLYGDGLIRIAVDRQVLTAATGIDGERLDALVSNSGSIIAGGGIVQMTANAARNIVDNVINMSGTVRVQTAEMVNGEILLSGGENGVVAVSGTLDASGRSADDAGGSVKVLGEKVALLDGAHIDVSGNAGGGSVMVGGNFQGKGTEQNAIRTFIGTDTLIAADAVVSGDGGNVVVWANELTAYNGKITAKGGASGGDGGFVEVSGKQNLIFRGTVDLAASDGALGTLLLDPQDIVIQGGTGDGTADTDTLTNSFGGGTAGTALFADFTGSVTVRESEIEGLNANIVLEAANSVSATGTFTSGLVLVSGRSLAVRTRNDVGDDAGSAQTAGINVSGISTISATGGVSMATGTGSNSAGGAVANITTAALTAAGAAISLNAGNGGTITTGALTSTGGSNQAGGAVTVTGTGLVTLGAVIASGGTATSGNNGQNAGAVTVTGGDVTVAAITANGSAGVGTDRNGGTGGAIALDAVDVTPLITLGGSLTASGGAATGTGTGGTGGVITVSDAATLTANVVLSNAGGSGAAGGGQNILGTVDGNTAGTRTLTLTGGNGDVTVGGIIGGTTALSALTVTGNDISLAGIGTSGTAGVTGATAVTAANFGADTGSITFTGNTYNANAQTYTGVAGETLLINAGTATTFTSTADTIAFNTGTVKLAGGSNLTVDSAGGAITIGAGIRGTSAEAVTLTSGAGAGNIAVGQIGSGNEIASVAITSGTGTTTLSGNIKTADVANNNVTITGPVTSAVAVGGTLSIDTAGATNKGTIAINGAVTSAARNLVLSGGTITTGAVTSTGGAGQAGGSVTATGSGPVSMGALTSTGGSNQAGGAVTVTGTGLVTLGAVIASGGTATSGNNGQNAGGVTVTGGDVTVAAITTNGSAGVGTDRNGGSGGAIALDAVDGTPLITLGGSLTASGGAATGTGTGGTGGAITVSDAATLTANVVLSNAGGSGAAGGGQNILGTVDGNTAGTRTLTLTGGNGDVTVGGIIGGTTALSALTVTGNDISLAGIGTSGAAGVTGATAVTAANFGADTGSITLGGTVRTTGAQTYAGTAMSMSIGGDLITANQNITIANPLVLTSGAELVAGSGTIALNSTVVAGVHALTLTADEVNLAGNVSGSGNLAIRPGLTTSTMVVGAAANTPTTELDLTVAELGFIQAGFSGVTFGRSDATANVTVNAIATGTLKNNATFKSGTGTIILAGDIATSGQSVTFDGAAQLSANRIIATAGGNIAFNGAVTGNAAGRNLTLQSGAGNITVAGNAGTTGVRLGTLSTDLSGTIGFQGTVAAGALTLANTTSATFNGAVNLTGALTLPASVGNAAFLDGFIAGSASIANTGSLQIGDASGDATTVTGGLDTTAVGGTVSLGGIVATTNTALTLGGVALGADTILNAGNAAITTGAVTGNTRNLTLAGSGAATLASAANLGTLALTETGGSVTVSGNLAASALTTAANNYSVALNGATTTIGGATAFSNTGAVTLGDGGDSLTFTGGLDTTAVGGTVSLGGTVATTNTALSTGAVSLNASTTLNAGSGTVTMGTVNAGAHSFGIVAGDVTLNGNWSGTGAWSLAPSANASTIGLAGATGLFALDAAELAHLANGNASEITIGSVAGTGAILANAFSFDDPLVLRGGPITLLGALSKTSGGLTLTSSGALSGALNLAAGTGRLQIGATSAVLTGTINGVAGTPAALQVTLNGSTGSGPYTVNGQRFFIAPVVPVVSHTQTVNVISQVASSTNNPFNFQSNTFTGNAGSPAQSLIGNSATNQPYTVQVALDGFSLSLPASTLNETAAAAQDGLMDEAVGETNEFLRNFQKK